MRFIIRNLISSDKYQFLRFSFVGAMATLTHLLSALCLTALYQKEISIYAVNLFSFIIAFFASYAGHRYLTFCQSGNVIKFFVVASSGFVVNNVVLIFVTYMGLKDFIAIATSTIFIPLATYTFSKLWAFKKGNKL